MKMDALWIEISVYFGHNFPVDKNLETAAAD
jgi:hypothetical protein